MGETHQEEREEKRGEGRRETRRMRGRGWRRAIRRGLGDSFRQDPPVGPVVQGERSAEGADFAQERRGVSRQRVPDASGQGVREGQPHLAAGQ
eukprot:7003113-Pyramimonas_sp.AAC.1